MPPRDSAAKRQSSIGIRQSPAPAFTLVELLVVMLIILILMTLALWAVQGLRHALKVNTARAELASLKTAIEKYKDLYGAWPDRPLPDPRGRCANFEIVRLLSNWRVDVPLTEPSGRNKQFNRDPVLARLDARQLDAEGNWHDPWDSPYSIEILPDDVWNVYQKIARLRSQGQAYAPNAAESLALAPYDSSAAAATYWVNLVKAQVSVYSLGPDRKPDSDPPNGDDLRP